MDHERNSDLDKLMAEPGQEKDKGRLYDFLLGRVEVILAKSAARDERLFSVCSLLRDFVPFIDWAGFYLADPEKPKELVLGPFVGKPTDHVRIQFGQGICGQAAETEQTFVVPDVSKETNYLSCSPDVKSEIVLPVMKDGKFVAELDIDSHTLAPFDDEDRKFLEKVSEFVAKVF